MSSAQPPWAEALKSEIAAKPEAGFAWLDPGIVDQARELTRGAFDQFAYGDELQEQGRARIARSVPLASGPTRTVRLTQSEQAMLLWFDPEQPARVYATLGTHLLPLLWPSAEPTLAGITRDLEPYLARPFKTRAELSRSVRIVRGTLEEMGFESIDAFAKLLGGIEPWLDSSATWGSACDDDPWPDDPSKSSMLQLRVIAEQAREQRGNRRYSIGMRTLWSRSLLILEHSGFDAVTFELRYDPAPLVAHLPTGDGPLLVPEDLPADLLASLVRSGSTTPASVAKVRQEGLTPWVGLVTSVLEPGESTTLETLREILEDPEHHHAAAGLAADIGARGLLYQIACDDPDPELRARAAEWVAIGDPDARDAAPDDEDAEDDSDDEDDQDDEDDEDDEDDASEDEDADDDEEEGAQ